MSQHDVIVVGGGFTGLSASVALADAGVDVVLLEARDRVGGRVESEVLDDGLRVDTGGQFLCEDMPEVVTLAKTHGKTMIRAHEEGDVVFQPPIPVEEGYANWEASHALRLEARKADLNDPAIAFLTVSEWVTRQDASDAAKRGYLTLIDGLWCRSPDDISFVHLSATDRRITNNQSEMSHFLDETMHSLAEDLAHRLGERVKLASPVSGIGYSPDGVEVGSGGKTLSARRAIIAIPPVMAGRLDYHPPLPERTAKAFDAWGSGFVIKALVRYGRPFWRDRDLSGTVMWREPQGLYACDASRGDRYPALVVFIGGTLAREWHLRDEKEVRQFILERLVAALGEDAGKPLSVTLRDWTNDRWSGGAYADMIVDVRAADAETTLNEGLPNVSFASSELSPSYPGYIEGAIVAGRLAAAEVLSRLRR